VSEPNECYAYFGISGSFDPAEITNRVGIIPTRTAGEGESIPGSNARKKYSRWSLHSRLERTATLEMHVLDVLEQLDGNEPAFKQLSEEFGGVMELVGHFSAFYPGLFLDCQTVSRLAQYALSVDCDFYVPELPGKDSDHSRPDAGEHIEMNSSLAIRLLSARNSKP